LASVNKGTKFTASVTNCVVHTLWFLISVRCQGRATLVFLFTYQRYQERCLRR